MSLSLDGLVSGLKTTEVIKALMDVAAIPRSLLKAKMDDKNGIVTQLRTLNTAVQNLATAAEKAATRDGLARFTTTSSSPTVTVATREGAAPLAADIVVDKVAKNHTIVSAASNGWPVDPPVITLENAKGERVQVTADSSSMQDVARAVNEAGFGIVAAAVPAGRDADGNPMHRLQLRAADSGKPDSSAPIAETPRRSLRAPPPTSPPKQEQPSSTSAPMRRCGCGRAPAPSRC